MDEDLDKDEDQGWGLGLALAALVGGPNLHPRLYNFKIAIAFLHSATNLLATCNIPP